MNTLPFLASLATAAPGFDPGVAAVETVASCAPSGEPPPRRRFLLGLVSLVGLIAMACVLATLVS